MNNFVFSQDPLLYTSLVGRQMQQQPDDLKRQLDEAMAQYQTLSQAPQVPTPPQLSHVSQTKDYLGEIDDMIRGLDEDVALSLNSDVEYLKINDDIQKMIQEEMMRSVKWKINSSPEAVNKLNRIKELIVAAQKTKSEEDRKVMADINDYIKNYSDLTFDEYKQLKHGRQ